MPANRTIWEWDLQMWKRTAQPSQKQKTLWKQVDLVNGKPIPFGDRGVSELTASVLVPRGSVLTFLESDAGIRNSFAQYLENNFHPSQAQW